MNRLLDDLGGWSEYQNQDARLAISTTRKIHQSLRWPSSKRSFRGAHFAT